MVSLDDLVDGMNLSEEWGQEHLNLSGTSDVAWAEQKNEAIRASVPLTENSCLLELSDAAFSRKEIWESSVRGRDRRLGVEMPKEVHRTRFYLRDSGDPRLSDRDYV